ncbi:MAG: 50S ribosomal protein L35 [Propionibacteriaceae bacterium]|jgi:large subunit ribosomal protein L35|nr:50S ribosomal protein L35 [Propionibacteriaceae bacterium]
MPKMKTHSGAKKRFKVTGTGKLVHQQAGKAHLNEHKARKRKRRLSGQEVVDKVDTPKTRKLLGI